jgi:TonB family protein
MRALSLLVALSVPLVASAQSMCGRLESRDRRAPLRDQAVLLFRDSSSIVRVADSTVTDSAGAFCFGPTRESEYVIAIRKSATELLRSPPAFLPQGVSRRALFKVDLAKDTIVSDWGMETPVRPRSGLSSIGYPQELRGVCLRGIVLLTFVVDTTGRVDSTTVLVRRSDDPRFTRAVLSATKRFRYEPARIERVKVRQLVQQPFDFRPSQADGCP